MKGKRTNLEFKEHELLITEQEGLLVHHLKKPDTNMDNIKFINTNGIMVVTGDYGNWVFCREFHPSATSEQVSDGYLIEKLQILSCQDPYDYDVDATLLELQNNFDNYIKDCNDSEVDPDESVIEYFDECINLVYDELDYTHYAYRERPSFMDYDEIAYVKSPKYWLQVVFDGFEEICRRLNENKKSE